MSKYKCISDINRQCIHIPLGIGCSKLCYDSYQQGRADVIDEIETIMNGDYTISVCIGKIEQWLKEKKNE